VDLFLRGSPSLVISPSVVCMHMCMYIYVYYTYTYICCGNLKLRYGTLRQFSRKQHFIVLAQTHQTPLQRLSPENQGVSPYTPLQAGYRSKKQSLTHIWLHVTLLAISFPQCYVTFLMF
jgi:hypothetical protein